MRLRRLELIFVGITLAFVFFVAGFFTGRNNNSVTISEFSSLQVETSRNPGVAEVKAEPEKNNISIASPVIIDSAITDSSDNTVHENTEPTPIQPGAPRGGDGRININTASKNELMDLPGIGPSLANNIIDYRNNNGTFKTIEDIMNVSGIATGRFERIKDKITV